jgi:hypothetical protein
MHDPLDEIYEYFENRCLAVCSLKRQNREFYSSIQQENISNIEFLCISVDLLVEKPHKLFSFQKIYIFSTNKNKKSIIFFSHFQDCPSIIEDKDDFRITNVVRYPQLAHKTTMLACSHPCDYIPTPYYCTK